MGKNPGSGFRKLGRNTGVSGSGFFGSETLAPKLKFALKFSGTNESIITPSTINPGIDYWYRFCYEEKTGRFENLAKWIPEDETERLSCITCKRKVEIENSKMPQFLKESGKLIFRNQTYQIGQGVMLEPNTFEIKHRQKTASDFHEIKEKDSETYPEYWRKTAPKSKEIAFPFDIGIIQKIFHSVSGELMLKVRNYKKKTPRKFQYIRFCEKKNLILNQKVVL